jgi:glycosyltransferase involved in cell wall biosynthesis
MENTKKLLILGIRGVPAKHGGFETFAEKLALYLTSRGWEVTVYCQENGRGDVYKDSWNSIKRVIIPAGKGGAFSSIVFDWLSCVHALNEEGIILTLGYNTAAFSFLYRIKGRYSLINMDGIEWKRNKWNKIERIWLYINERLACVFGNHLIADHPQIMKHLLTRVSKNKVTMIPYGAEKVTSADISLISQFNLLSNEYLLIIARPEPENSILEIVRAFSRMKRGKKLVVLGEYNRKESSYQNQIIESASSEVCFLGPIYEKDIVEALRFYAYFYLHGHTVGGTNPSLVEAMGVGSAVVAHDNVFNRWVAGEKALYFSNEEECALLLDKLFDSDKLIHDMRAASLKRFEECFTWRKVLEEYEELIQASTRVN